MQASNLEFVLIRLFNNAAHLQEFVTKLHARKDHGSDNAIDR
jgi:hypothetical protein